MVKEVIKRGGKKEAFRPEKIRRSIRAAVKDAHLSASRAKIVVGKVYRSALKSFASRKTIKTSVLRSKVLSQLAKVEPAAAKAWRKYDQRRRARRARRR